MGKIESKQYKMCENKRTHWYLEVPGHYFTPFLLAYLSWTQATELRVTCVLNSFNTTSFLTHLQKPMELQSSCSIIYYPIMQEGIIFLLSCRKTCLKSNLNGECLQRYCDGAKRQQSLCQIIKPFGTTTIDILKRGSFPLMQFAI